MERGFETLERRETESHEALVQGARTDEFYQNVMDNRFVDIFG
jgi:hypothetical protein